MKYEDLNAWQKGINLVKININKIIAQRCTSPQSSILNPQQHLIEFEEFFTHSIRHRAKKMNKLNSLLVIILLLISPILFAKKATPILDRLDVQSFINEMVIQHQFNRFTLTKLFSKVNFNPLVLTLIKHPYEDKPWHAYKKHFIVQERIQLGVKFWQKHKIALDKAYQKFGVSPEIIVAIIGVETEYGKNLGTFRVLDSLSTLAFQYPERAAFFHHELVEYLLLCHQNNINPLSVYGSYAGAFGLPQFMPSSAMNYAISLSHHGHLDLMHNAKDAIDSVANYLHAAGWEKNQPVLMHAKIYQPKKLEKFMVSSKSADLTPLKLKSYGIALPHDLSSTKNIGLIKAETAKNHYGYWLGFHNLFVITQYNTSIQYAMAVDNLADAIKKAVQGGATAR